MAGKVVSDNPPLFKLNLTVDLNDRVATEEQIEAMFDSGFNGDVSIPRELIGNGNAPAPEARVPITIANGDTIWVPSYQGGVAFNELEGEIAQPIPVSVFVMGENVLVGRGLMDHFLVVLDHGRTMTVEP